MSDARTARLCLVTHPRAGAGELARSLVERRIAACVNQIEATSVYSWEGAVEADAEVLLLIKTTAERLPELEAVLAAEHPYDVPELIALEPAAVGRAYLAWWNGATAR